MWFSRRPRKQVLVNLGTQTVSGILHRKTTFLMRVSVFGVASVLSGI